MAESIESLRTELAAARSALSAAVQKMDAEVATVRADAAAAQEGLPLTDSPPSRAS